MKKRSIQISAFIATALMASSWVSARAGQQNGIEKPLPPPIGSAASQTSSKKSNEVPVVPSTVAKDGASTPTPLYSSRFSTPPTDKRLKEIREDFVQFRADLALRHLAPIVTTRAKNGLKRPQDQVAMARLMELVGYSYLLDDNFQAAINSLTIAHKICPDDAHVKCMLINLLRELPDFDAEDRLVAELNKIPEKDRFPYLYLTLARSAKRNGNFRQAMDYLDKADAMDVEKRHSNIQALYARMLVLSGLNTAALDRFKKAADRTENKYLREIILASAAQI